MASEDDAINRSLDEVIARYQLHPELCDIYVEGEGDQGLIDWFLEQHQRYSVAVYTVGVLNIPDHIVVGYGLEHRSRRSQVIALALELEANFEGDIHVTCIADSDFGFFTGRKSSKALVYTDYCSLEMYAFAPSVVEKLIRMVAPRLRVRGEEILERIEEILQTFFALRLANKQLGFGLAWVDTERCMTLESGYPSFDLSEYVRRYLNTKGRRRDQNSFDAQVMQIRAAFFPDVRFQIRGHDFVDVLTWYLRKSVRSCRHLTVDSVRTMLLIQLRAVDLQQENMFRELLARSESCA